MLFELSDIADKIDWVRDDIYDLVEREYHNCPYGFEVTCNEVYVRDIGLYHLMESNEAFRLAILEVEGVC